MAQVLELFGDMNLEIQGTTVHYLLNASEKMVALYDNLQWRYTHAKPGDDVGPFIKFSLFGQPDQPVVSSMFSGNEEELRRFDLAEATLREMYGDKVEVFRAAPRIIDVHAKGVSKINSARQLQKTLNKKLLVCVGDAENDIPMLDGADYAFCPADGVVADRYETVCDCGSGAVADVIYKKIPEIVANHP
jgi:hydroxymethylpyrimidine pyrophosphatase-like HAD family hydrolase